MSVRMASATALTLLALASCQTAPRRPPGPQIARAPSCTAIAFPIYFEADSARVTPEAERLIADAGRRAAGCQVLGVAVTGLADAAGAPGANLALSQRRAEAVSAALQRRGLIAVAFRERAVGAMGAQTAAGTDRPVRRRAEVSISLAAKPTAH